MSHPLFSVIIPTNGRPQMLPEAVASVLQQTVDDLECVVVDDSGLGIGDIPSDPRVHVVGGQGSGGAAVARNAGLSVARGRYVTFLDDDDLLTSDRLAIALDGLAVAPIALCWRGSVGAEDKPPTWRRSLEGNIRRRILQGPIPHVGQVAIERTVSPRFDPRFRVSEDVEWWVRTAATGDAATVARIGYLQRDHDGVRQTARLDERLTHRLLLLDVHADYFDSNKKAAAYQWRRVGGLARAAGDRALERHAFRRSLTLHPGWRSLASLGRTYLGVPTNHGH